jgi:hypothetical protein
MKKLLLTLSAFFLLIQSYAQKIEITLQANSGLFHYSGNSTAASSFFLPGQTANQYRSNNPYGSENGFSYGAGAQAAFVSKNGFIIGLQAGYEVLKSKEAINGVYPYYNYYAPDFYTIATANSSPVPARGQAFTINRDITLNPYIGYRLHARNIKIDLMPGVDISYNVNSYNKGKATASDGTVYTANDKLPKAPNDLRLRFGAAASWGKWGITASYAHGLVNYVSNLDYYLGEPAGRNIVRSEVVRFGISYRIF